MRVLQINSFFSVGGPPRIVKGIYDTLIEHGHDCVVAAGREKPIEGMKIIKIGTPLNKYWHLFMSRVFDAQGLSSKLATRRLLKEIDEYNPDIIHLHNLHGYYLNIGILFDYLKKVNKPVVWTLHDCWPFTGHCSYFDYADCSKWKVQCDNCPQKKEYPTCNIFDNSKRNYIAKKKIFTEIDNLTFVTPSKWLASKLSESFLSKYPVKVIYNGIDLNVFKPTEGNFREKYNLQNKKIVLGVAQVWEKRKGLTAFYDLARVLDSSYKIVLVGLSEGQISSLPDDIMGLSKTNNIQELLELYTTADVFVNPTLEDNFPTVNLESLSCGTPVITYDTGGSPEAIDDTSGIVIRKGDINALKEAIDSICNSKAIKSEDCLLQAKKFSKDERYIEYIKLYEELLNESLISN